MNRLHLFEFEDFHWFPDLIRSPMTRLIAVLNKKMGLDEAVSLLVGNMIDQTKIRTVVDLGSGSGGVMPLVHSVINSNKEKEEVNFLLTDLYPSKESVERFNSLNDDSLTYHPESIDATKLEGAPKGIKTMINSFHHMDAETAKSILASAQNNQEPILIFEMQEKKIPVIIWVLFLPLGLLITFVMALVLTLFSRPIKLSQLFFTYLIPIIPMCFAWDGQASYARMYSMSDYDELLSGMDDQSYKWEKGVGKKKDGKALGTYLIGMPSNSK